MTCKACSFPPSCVPLLAVWVVPVINTCKLYSAVGWGGLRPRVWRDTNIQISKIITASHWSFLRFVLWGWQKITVLQACSPNLSYHSASMRIHAQCINLHFLQVPLRHHMYVRVCVPACVCVCVCVLSIHYFTLGGCRGEGAQWRGQRAGGLQRRRQCAGVTWSSSGRVKKVMAPSS